eukprot:scaffold198706_cov31-Tisochrysis_lutea.AAC.1
MTTTLLSAPPSAGVHTSDIAFIHPTLTPLPASPLCHHQLHASPQKIAHTENQRQTLRLP